MLHVWSLTHQSPCWDGVGDVAIVLDALHFLAVTLRLLYHRVLFCNASDQFC